MGTPGGCNAGVNGRFVLDSVNYPVWSFFTIAEVNPKETWITHGSEDGLLRWCELHQRKARALHLVGRDLEEEA